MESGHFKIQLLWIPIKTDYGRPINDTYMRKQIETMWGR